MPQNLVDQSAYSAGNTERVREFLEMDWRMIGAEMADMVRIAPSSIHHILMNILINRRLLQNGYLTCSQKSRYKQGGSSALRIFRGIVQKAILS